MMVLQVVISGCPGIKRPSQVGMPSRRIWQVKFTLVAKVNRGFHWTEEGPKNFVAGEEGENLWEKEQNKSETRLLSGRKVWHEFCNFEKPLPKSNWWDFLLRIHIFSTQSHSLKINYSNLKYFAVVGGRYSTQVDENGGERRKETPLTPQ